MPNQSNNEPLRPLTREEFEILRAGIRESYEPKKANPRIQVNANKIAEAEFAAGEEGMEIGLKVWKMRKAGRTRSAIHQELGIPYTVLDACLREFEIRMGMEAGRMMEHYRVLEDERIEDMMSYWLPIACEGRIRIEKVRAGEVYSEVDFDRPLKAAFLVLQAMNMRLKIMMAARPEGAKESGTNVLVWLQQCLPGVAKVVKTIEMETETEKP